MNSAFSVAQTVMLTVLAVVQENIMQVFNNAPVRPGAQMVAHVRITFVRRSVRVFNHLHTFEMKLHIKLRKKVTIKVSQAPYFEAHVLGPKMV